MREELIATCLNPYSTGIWSATFLSLREQGIKWVLILILLEYGLRQAMLSVANKQNWSLNPYSTGIWSATR